MVNVPKSCANTAETGRNSRVATHRDDPTQVLVKPPVLPEDSLAQALSTRLDFSAYHNFQTPEAGPISSELRAAWNIVKERLQADPLFAPE